MKQELHLPSQTYLVLLKNTSCGAGFYDEACYDYYLKRLNNSLNQFHVYLHAYCFLANEIYLLVTPTTPLGLTHLLGALNEQYADYYNLRFDRETNRRHWRCTSSLIYGDSLALDCQKLVETLPGIIGLVEHPGTHHWSSYCSNAFGAKSIWITPHRAYRKFLQDNAQSLRAYREYLETKFAAGYMSYLFHRLHLGIPPVQPPEEFALTPVARRRVVSSTLH